MTPLDELCKQQIIERICKLIAESGQSSLKFLFVDVTRSIFIERLETVSPIFDVFPELFELLEVKLALMASIEHGDHEFDCFGIEWFPGSIWETSLEFSGIDGIAAIFVNLLVDFLQESRIDRLSSHAEDNWWF